MDDLAFRPATELLASLASGEVSSRELLDLYLARVERLNPPLNAVVTLDVERAREAADAADDARARGEARGVLHGLPMTIKDSFETAGVRTTSGAPELADHVPDRDADAVARLKAAGAVVFGKTNLPIYAGDTQSYNDVFGTTNNPWDTSRGPGGSSGGAAAALAAGLTGLELGSDIGGSIRNPAHFCGVFGLKPSYGVVSTRGHIPYPPGALSVADVGVAGPMGRSVDDLALGLDVLAGPDEWQSTAWWLELPPPRRGSLPEYRAAAWLDDPACPVAAEVREVLERAVGELRTAGAKVDDQARPAIDWRDAHRMFGWMVAGAVSPGMPEEMFRMACQMADEPEQPAEGYLTRGARYTAQRHRDWLRHAEERAQQRARWAEFFRDHDLLLCPVTATAAFPHDQSFPYTRTMHVDGTERDYWEVTTGWCGVIGVSYLPSAVVPAGRTSTGLPVGVQVVGPYLEDRTVLDAARRITEVLGGFTPPPGY